MEHQSQKGLIAFVFAAGVSACVLWLRRRRRLPPGSPWSLPLLGETLTYVRDPLGFIEARVPTNPCICSLLSCLQTC